MMATNPGSIADYSGIGKLASRPLPTIMVPTTAGSGSEVSSASIFLNDLKAVKLGKAARDDIDDDTVIECGNGHALTVAEAVRIYEGCMP